MEHSKLAWEDVSKFEEIKGYGQHVWRHHEKYFFVTDEGGIAEQRVVYEFPLELFQLLLENSLIKLTKSSATDLYISILFFDSILFMEDKGIATFKIDTSKLVSEIASGIQKIWEELTKSITFDNGLTKKDPMNLIVRFNQIYKNKYNFSILED